MHHPPEVRLFVSGSPWPRRLLAVVGLLALTQVSWFIFVNGRLMWETVAIGVSFLASIAFAWRWAQGGANGNLYWDGAQWHWSGLPGGACVLQRHLDFQTLMLVSLRAPQAQPVWLWLQRSHDPRQWLALRRAVVHTTSFEQVLRANGTAATRHIDTP